MEALYRDYEPLGVRFLYVYKALAHPELNGYVKPVTLEERLMHVAEAKRTLGTGITWLADNMANELKHALGDAPNSEFVVDPQGNVVVRRLWSDPTLLRGDLERLVGPVAEPTAVGDLDLPTPAYYQPTVATGVVPPVELSGRMTPLTLEITASKNDLPAYAKLRAEADSDLLEGGSGTLYLGFHLDPLYRVHWNNLAPQPEFAITVPEGVSVTPASATFPDVEVEADADAREFLIEVRADGIPDEPLELTTTYYACDNDNTWCVPVTQSYSIWLTADPDGGRVFGRGAGGRIGQGGRPGGDQVQGRGQGPGQGRMGPEAMLDRMRSWDVDGDGFIVRDEVPEQMRERMFDRADTNDDGLLDADELEAMVASMGNRGRR